MSEALEEVINESDEEVESDEPVAQDAGSISDKDCPASSTSSAKNTKLLKMEKVKRKRKRLVNMMNWNGKRALQ